MEYPEADSTRLGIIWICAECKEELHPPIYCSSSLLVVCGYCKGKHKGDIHYAVLKEHLEGK